MMIPNIPSLIGAAVRARDAKPEGKDMSHEELACRECGHIGHDFRTVVHRCPGEADDYDAECPECGSYEISDSAAEALSMVTDDLDTAKADRATLRAENVRLWKLLAKLHEKATKYTHHRDADGEEVGYCLSPLADEVRAELVKIKVKA